MARVLPSPAGPTWRYLPPRRTPSPAAPMRAPSEGTDAEELGTARHGHSCRRPCGGNTQRFAWRSNALSAVWRHRGKYIAGEELAPYLAVHVFEEGPAIRFEIMSEQNWNFI